MLKVCSGITLIELLVVIMIIAILVWFMTCFGISAPRPARQAWITMEIQQLSCAIENLKNVYGEYPPNLIENAIREDMSVPGVTEQISVSTIPGGTLAGFVMGLSYILTVLLWVILLIRFRIL